MLAGNNHRANPPSWIRVKLIWSNMSLQSLLWLRMLISTTRRRCSDALYINKGNKTRLICDRLKLNNWGRSHLSDPSFLSAPLCRLIWLHLSKNQTAARYRQAWALKKFRKSRTGPNSASFSFKCRRRLIKYLIKLCSLSIQSSMLLHQPIQDRQSSSLKQVLRARLLLAQHQPKLISTKCLIKKVVWQMSPDSSHASKANRVTRYRFCTRVAQSLKTIRLTNQLNHCFLGMLVSHLNPFRRPNPQSKNATFPSLTWTKPSKCSSQSKAILT